MELVIKLDDILIALGMNLFSPSDKTTYSLIQWTPDY